MQHSDSESDSECIKRLRPVAAAGFGILDVMSKAGRLPKNCWDLNKGAHAVQRPQVRAVFMGGTLVSTVCGIMLTKELVDVHLQDWATNLPLPLPRVLRSVTVSMSSECGVLVDETRVVSHTCDFEGLEDLHSLKLINCVSSVSWFKHVLLKMPTVLKEVEIFSASGLQGADHLNFPDSVTRLTILNRRSPIGTEEVTWDLPVNLKYLCLHKVAVSALPAGLKELSIRGDLMSMYIISELPQGIELVQLADLPAVELQSLPSTVKILKIKCASALLRLGQLPESLQVLHMDNPELSESLGPLPSGLQELVFGRDTPYTLPLALPSGLRVLTLPRNFNQSITLPRSLQELSICYSYSKRLHVPEHAKVQWFI